MALWLRKPEKDPDFQILLRLLVLFLRVTMIHGSWYWGFDTTLLMGSDGWSHHLPFWCPIHPPFRDSEQRAFQHTPRACLHNCSACANGRGVHTRKVASGPVLRKIWLARNLNALGEDVFSLKSRFDSWKGVCLSRRCRPSSSLDFEIRLVGLVNVVSVN